MSALTRIVLSTYVVVLLASCGSIGRDSEHPPFPHDVAQLISTLGPPPIRFAIDARLADELLDKENVLRELPDDIRVLVEHVEFLGYYAGPETIARFSAMNDVVVSRTLVALPVLTVAEEGELGSEGRRVALDVGGSSAEIVELLGTPNEYRRSDEKEVMTFASEGDLVIAFASEGRVWSIFTLRIAQDLEPNYRDDLATTIMDAFVNSGGGFDLGRNREHVMHMLRAGER